MAECDQLTGSREESSAIMSASDLVNLSGLMDDAKCFALERQHRWPENVCCPGCNSSSMIRDGCDDTQPHRQRYLIAVGTRITARAPHRTVRAVE